MIFIVEDDAGIRELECYALAQAGFETRGFESGEDLFDALKRERPQLILLDVMLPHEDGNRILSRLRRDGRTSALPVMMVTAKGQEWDKVQSLDGGADDYLVKPFGVMELISRVKALLRRSQRIQTQELSCGPVRLDVQRHRVFVEESEVTLTHMEFELLRYLLENRGIAMTREKLLNAVWGLDYLGDSRTVDVHMRTLRAKLGRGGDVIHTLRGVGYRLEE